MHVDCKLTRKMLVLHVLLHIVLHVCCMCVACALHEQGRRKNFGWQARDFARSRPPCHLSIHLCGVVTYCRHTFVWGCHRSRKRVLRRWVYVSELDVVTSPCMCVHIEKTRNKKSLPGFFKKTAIHRKKHRCIHYPSSPQLQCCAWKCRTL